MFTRKAVHLPCVPKLWEEIVARSRIVKGFGNAGADRHARNDEVFKGKGQGAARRITLKFGKIFLTAPYDCTKVENRTSRLILIETMPLTIFSAPDFYAASTLFRLSFKFSVFTNAVSFRTCTA